MYFGRRRTEQRAVVAERLAAVRAHRDRVQRSDTGMTAKAAAMTALMAILLSAFLSPDLAPSLAAAGLPGLLFTLLALASSGLTLTLGDFPSHKGFRKIRAATSLEDLLLVEAVVAGFVVSPTRVAHRLDTIFRHRHPSPLISPETLTT